MSPETLKHIVEAALLAAGRPLSVDNLLELFGEHEEKPERTAIRSALETLQREWEGRSVELVRVASGFRFQVRKDYSAWVSRLWAERPARYSRALLETLALIAYRQPITRGEIEEVRGVSLSSSIMRTLQEHEWIRVVGHRDVPGRPATYGTTQAFLDHFNLKSLDDLPPLSELRDLDSVPDDLFAQLESSPPAERVPVDQPSPPLPFEERGSGASGDHDHGGGVSPASSFEERGSEAGDDHDDRDRVSPPLPFEGRGSG